MRDVNTYEANKTAIYHGRPPADIKLTRLTWNSFSHLASSYYFDSISPDKQFYRIAVYVNRRYKASA
jgi:hypothetical protein